MFECIEILIAGNYNNKNYRYIKFLELIYENKLNTDIVIFENLKYFLLQKTDLILPKLMPFNKIPKNFNNKANTYWNKKENIYQINVSHIYYNEREKKEFLDEINCFFDTLKQLIIYENENIILMIKNNSQPIPIIKIYNKKNDLISFEKSNMYYQNIQLLQNTLKVLKINYKI